MLIIITIAKNVGGATSPKPAAGGCSLPAAGPPRAPGPGPQGAYNRVA